MKAYLEISSITKSYNNKKIFDELNIRIEKGKFISIIGPYGSGKTTILKMISGIENYDYGTIKIDGKNITEIKKEGKIGFSFQDPLLLPWRTVYENIKFPCDVYNKDYSEKINELLSLVELDKKANFYPKELSGGMQRIVSILRAIVLDPDILLLDEPLSAIDEVNRDEFHEKLIKLHNKNKLTTILVTHSIHEAVYLSDEVYLLGNNASGVVNKIKINKPRVYNNKYSQEVLKQVNEIKMELRRVIKDA